MRVVGRAPALVGPRTAHGPFRSAPGRIWGDACRSPGSARAGDCERALRTGLAIFMLGLGIAWASFACAAFLSLAGMSTLIWGIGFVAVWGAVFGGPLLQILGSTLVLVRRANRLASVLILAGSVVITGIIVLDASGASSDWKHGRLDRSALAFEMTIIALAAAGNIGAIALFRFERPDPR